MLGRAVSDDAGLVTVTANRTLQGPLFSSGASDLQVPRYRPTDVPVIWFITSPENEAMTRAVSAIWHARQPNERAISVTIGEQVDADRTVSVAAWSGDRARAAPALHDMLAKPGALSPMLILDLTAKGSVPSAVADFLEFTGAPVVRPGPVTATATGTISMDDVVAAFDVGRARRRTPRPAGTFGAILDDVVPDRRSVSMLAEFLD